MNTMLRRRALATAVLLAAPLSLAHAQRSDATPAQESKSTECTCTCEACAAAHGRSEPDEPKPTRDAPVAPRNTNAARAGERAFLGVRVSGGEGEGEGALIASIEDGSAAGRAKLKAGDRIVAIEGEAVETIEDLLAALSARRPGDPVTIDFERDGKKRSRTVELGARPSEPSQPDVGREVKPERTPETSPEPSRERTSEPGPVTKPEPTRKAPTDAPERRGIRGGGDRIILSPTEVTPSDEAPRRRGRVGAGGGESERESIQARIRRLEDELAALQAELEELSSQLKRRRR